LGKTELAQLSITDLIFVLLISNAVQNAMVGSDTTLGGGILAASVLFILNLIFKKLKYKFPSIKKVIEGEPVILIHKGKLLEENCRKNDITKDELLQAIREHGSSSFEDVDSLILEADGNISVVSNQYKHHSVRRLKKRKNA
jgi:uncharacterized membrane protein YcaP (DUF421 family)